jgi:transposase
VVDPTSVRAYQCAARQKSALAEALGRSCGRFTSRSHAVVDAWDLLVRLAPTPGQQADCTVAAGFLAGLAVGAVLADKAAGAPRVNWTVPLYADCNKVERFVSRLKRYRCLATRYIKPLPPAFAQGGAIFVGFL